MLDVAVGHAYSTAVHDPASDLTGEVATIAVDAIAEQRFADLLRSSQPHAFFNELGNNVEGEQFLVLPIDPRALFPNGERPSRDALKILLAAALTRNWGAAVQAWQRQERPGAAVEEFIDQLLDAVVLAEHSDPEAAKAVAQIAAVATVGATAMPAAGAVGVALVGHGAALAVVIAGTGGVAVIGVGAAALVWGLFRWRRRR